MAKTPVKTESLPAVAGEPSKVMLPDTISGKYKVGRRITTPVHSLTHNGPIAFLCEGEIVAQPGQKEGKLGKKDMAVVPVINLETGEAVTLICPTVLESALKRTPGGYVGKKFYAIQGPKAVGKDYFQVEVFQLEG